MQLCLCALTVAALAQAQSGRKPGLYEVTSQMSMAGAGAPQMPSMPQLPPGTQLPPGMQMPASPFAPHTTQVCVTQAMIDKYGGPSPAPQHGQCKVTDVSMKSNGMTAKIVCTGQMNATGTVETTWTDANSSQTKMHMTGTMQMGSNSGPIDMTMQSTSVYKGPDCGSVKPPPMPPGN
jgi:hypothetical protein